MSQAVVKAKTTKAPRAKVYPFNARMNEEQKVLIQKPADLQGQTMTDFVLHSADYGSRAHH
jgi:uncharacterized protein (DUF1778 family)